ncbi:hypothetical protein KN63_02220 [Smithella sp. F21]|nr:hypothetical protein KN63_02220 [Smithella sp. F21]
MPKPVDRKMPVLFPCNTSLGAPCMQLKAPQQTSLMNRPARRMGCPMIFCTRSSALAGSFASSHAASALGISAGPR